MKFFDGNCSIQAMEDRLRILRVLRMGFHKPHHVDNPTFDVPVRTLDGVPTGADPSARSHTVADAVRSDSDPVPATAPWASSPLSVH